MDFQTVIQNLNKKQINPVYTVHGSEQYLQEEFLNTLYKAVNTEEEIDVVKFDLTEKNIDLIIDEAETYSFFSDFRLIIVNQVDLASTKPSFKLSKREEARLTNYINHPNPSSIVVFMIPNDQMDNRKKISKLFKKETTYVDITPLNEVKVQQYVEGYIKNTSIKITREATVELLQRVNYQLSQAMSEISKLESYALTGNVVTIEVVRQLVPRTLESDVFELTNAVVNRQINQAIQIYQDLILMKHEPIALHALLVSQFRIILQCSVLSRSGYREAEIAKQLGVHPYRVKLAIQSARQLPLNFQVKFYKELAQVDLNMKRGIGTKEDYFYLLLTKLVEM